MTGFNGWQDRKSHPGKYHARQNEEYCFQAERTTGPGATPGPYTDVFGLVFREGAATSSSGTTQTVCEISGCSESQVASVKDFSTNFCNMYNLYCSAAAGCSKALFDLPAPASVAYSASCTHGGVPEHDAAQCAR